MHHDNHRAGSWRHLFEFLQRGSQFLRRRNAVVPGRLIPHKQDTLPLMRMSDDTGWFSWLEWDIRERLQELRNIMTVHLANGPAKGTPFVGERFETHRLLRPVSLLQAVAVNDHGQVVELIVGC